MAISMRFLCPFAALALLPAFLACSKDKDDPAPENKIPTFTITGKVSYTRLPLLKNADGTPLSLETDPAKLQTLPARGIILRLLEAKTETVNGQNVTVWSNASSTSTDAEGKYTFTVNEGSKVFVEVMSHMTSPKGANVRVLADTLSADNHTVISERPLYTLRKGLDGSEAVSPVQALKANATVDFAIKADTAWWISQTSPAKSPEATPEKSPTGSRILAILDSAYQFASTVGDPTPGTTLHLHYKQSENHAHGTFVAFDRENPAYYPANTFGSSVANDGSVFGAVCGGQNGNDDAFDEGVLFPLFARNNLVSQGTSGLMPSLPLTNHTDLKDLRPDLALLEGMADAMAAYALKSPYLADTQAGSVKVRDIRVIPAEKNIYSAANIAAATWTLGLAANGTLAGGVITPLADTSAGWAKLDTAKFSRFFKVVAPKDASGNSNDLNSFYSQVARLQAAKAEGELVDLATYFTDANLKTLLAPYGIEWPRPKTGAEANFFTDWGTDLAKMAANSAFTLTMSKALKNQEGVYPNHSLGEAKTFIFSLGKERKVLPVLTGTIPADAMVEIKLNGKTFILSAAKPEVIESVDLKSGSHLMHVRLLSPNTQQADLALNLTLTTPRSN